jgi:hypothetical protein
LSPLLVVGFSYTQTEEIKTRLTLYPTAKEVLRSKFRALISFDYFAISAYALVATGGAVQVTLRQHLAQVAGCCQRRSRSTLACTFSNFPEY